MKIEHAEWAKEHTPKLFLKRNNEELNYVD